MHQNHQALETEIAALGPWFQNLHLPGGVETAPNHPYGDFPFFKWKQIAPCLPANLTGWRALDVGCNAGFYSFELARRGAEVIGIDHDPFYLRQAVCAARYLDPQHRVEFHEMQIYELSRDRDAFDLVLFMGVLYHLRYPMLGLDVISQKVKRLMVFQTLTMPGEQTCRVPKDFEIDDRDVLLDPGWPRMAFLEHSMAGDRTNWWAPNHACVEAMLRSSGIEVISRPGHEIYICRPHPERRSCVQTWNRAEFLAATGQSDQREFSRGEMDDSVSADPPCDE